MTMLSESQKNQINFFVNQVYRQNVLSDVLDMDYSDYQHSQITTILAAVQSAWNLLNDSSLAEVYSREIQQNIQVVTETPSATTTRTYGDRTETLSSEITMGDRLKVFHLEVDKLLYSLG